MDDDFIFGKRDWIKIRIGTITIGDFYVRLCGEAQQ